MSLLPLFISLLSLVCAVAAGESSSIVEFPDNKIWWTKELIPGDLYTAGRLTESQLKHAAEAGFKTIVAQFTWLDEGSIGEEILPDTDTIRYIVEDLIDLPFHVMLNPGDSVARVETVELFTSIYLEADKPVLYFCQGAFSATFISLNYLANQTVYDPSFEPYTDSEVIYQRATEYGFHYTSEGYRQLAADITGEPIVENPPAPIVSIPDWDGHYWLMKPVYENWYIAGQVRSNYLPLLNDAGFNSVLNARPGLTLPDGEPSQEEVTLLNIYDNTGTYVGTGRQSEQRLLETRIDETKVNEYISEDSLVNYASRNSLEFGDDIGYNEEIEREAVEDVGLEYDITPFGEYCLYTGFSL